LGGWVDPVTLGGKTMGYMADPGGRVSRGAGRLGAYTIGGMTGVGDVPVRLGADAGWQAGRHGDTAALDAFNANRTNPGGEAPATVDLAQDALNNFDRAEKNAYRSSTDPFFNATAGDTLDLSGVRAQLDAAMPERYQQLEHLPAAERPASHREWQRASEALDQQIALGVADPTNLNPRNLDAFKKDWRETIDFDPADPTYKGSISGVMPNDVADVISYRYPTEYPPIMERYGNFLDRKRSIRDAFGLGATPNAPINIESVGRKLGSSLRNNVNTNYGLRGTILEQLATHGAPTLPARLAGQAMSAPLPRGIQGAIFGSGASVLGAGLAALSPWSLASLPVTAALSSPRVAGRLVSGGARRLGAGVRAADEVVSALDAPLTTRFPSLNRPPSELYNAVRPAMDVGDMLERGGSQVDLDELERLRREYMLQGMPLPEDLPGYAKGGAVRRYAEGGPVKEESWYEDPANAARTFGSGVTFGFNDEIEAGLRALADRHPGAYRRERDRIRAEQAAYSERHPYATVALEGAGSILPSLIPGGAAATGARLGTRLALGAGRAGVEGALYGAGVAPEMSDIKQSMEDEALAATLMYGGGELAGAGLKATGRGAKRVYRKVRGR
jgi:hypothetical protein